MRVTVSLNKEISLAVVRGETELPNLRRLVEENSSAEIIRVFGRGRSASLKVDQVQLEQLKSSIGHLCVFARVAQAQLF